jgi:hypothetical protein
MMYFHSPCSTLKAAISASDTTMPLGYLPVSSSQRTVRPVLAGAGRQVADHNIEAELVG